jgi:hypothetical protein
MLSILISAAGILACGAVGAVAGLAVRGAFALDGTPGALVALFVAMIVATVAWALGTALLRFLRLIR